MKFKNVFLNYNIIIFIIFIIISTITSIQILPIWNDNIKIKDLDSNLLNSEILSYTIDNTTKEILYLIKENNENYLYINNVKLSNPYINDLKYFTSPLFNYNNKYYFCSSLKNIINFDLQGNFEKIENSFNDDSDYELKCFYHRDANSLAVTFINSHYMDFYDLANHQWATIFNRYFLTEMKGKIFDVTAYDVDTKDKAVFGVFFKAEVNYTFCILQYNWEYQIGPINNNITNFGFEFYSKNLVSFGVRKTDKRGFVFTYEPEVMNKYNFYILDLNWGTCLNRNGNLYFTMFQEAEIYNAYFIENTPVLIYLIRKIEKTGLYNFYLGAVDVETEIIIYNIKIDNYKKVFYDNGYLFNHEGYLRYFENGKVIEICPFIYSNNKCQFMLEENQYFDIEKSNGLNENKILNGCSRQIMFVQYCLDQCPIGYEIMGNGCNLCSIETSCYYLYATKTCGKPAKDYPNKGIVYYNCEETNTKYYDYGCYGDCAEIYGEIDHNNENQCITCQSNQKFFFNNKCVSDCNIEGYIEKNIFLNGIIYSFCLKCADIDQFYYNGQCYDECPYESQLYDSNKICYFCWERNSENGNIYFQEDKCVSECTNGYGIIDNDEEEFYCKYCKNQTLYLAHNKKCEKSCEKNALFYEENNICYFCNETSLKFYQEDECVSECSIGYESVNNEFYCRNCYKENLYYAHNKKCEESCEKYSLFHEDNNICYFCYETDLKYNQDDKCVSECSNGYEILENEFYCRNCYKENLYYAHNKKCESRCEKYSLFNKDNNICYFCNETTLTFYQDDICVSKCDEGYESIDNEFYCRNCYKENLYFAHNKKCEQKCENYSLFHEDNHICYFCNETKFKYYQDDVCVSKCDEGYESIDDEFYCRNCYKENLYYAHNKKCEQKCENYSLFYEDNNICYFCYETNLKYNQDDKCVSECSEGYETIESDYYCRNCFKEDLYYAHNKKCEQNCEEYSLFNEENKICYFCNETNLKFYQNKICVESCDKGWETNETHFYCRNCKDEDKYYLYGKCEDNCTGLAYNDKDNICINCTEEKKLFKDDDHSCVSSCGTYIREGDHCIPCPDENLFYEYECVEKCPNYTVLRNDRYCSICNGKFQEDECVDECSEGYAKSKEYIGESKIEVEVCYKCKGKTFLEGSECVENCQITKYASDDNTCRNCFCGFSIMNCNKTSDSCICQSKNINEGEIFGNNCEFYSKIERSKKQLEIIPLGPIISSQKSYFTFKLKDTEKDYNYSIKWGVFVNKVEIKDLKYFATGMNEEIFVINSGLLKPGDIEDEIFNEITLELNITDEFQITKTYHDSIYISIQSIYQKNKKIYFEKNINRVMNNTFEMKTDTLSGIEQIKFYYRILIKDEYNEIIPIKPKEELDPLLDKRKKNIVFILPYLKEFIFEMSSNRNEAYQISENIKNENLYINYKLNEIIQLGSLADYTEIEKIFLIMKYINLNKEEITSNEYNLLLDFIKNKSELVALANGYYEVKELNEAKQPERYYINYYEPNSVFSLLNKIFVNQETQIPDNYFNDFSEIFENFIDTIINQNTNETLDSSNILSYFRSFDHLLEIYIKKEKSEEKNLINRQKVFEILNKLSKYLIKKTNPGENIRLIGKKVSLFLSHFGKYQQLLSYGTTSETTKKLKYNDFNTFTYDNYNFNQENCDDEGNTLLCIQKDNLKKFKEKILDIENYSLLFISFNNEDNNLQKEDGENSFQIKIMNLSDVYQEYDNLSFFYDIEFPFNFEPYSYNSKQILTQDNNKKVEKDYSNITCIPKNHLNNKDLYCLTFFNYDTNIIKCSCNVMDEITYISDYEVANFYKDIQTKGKFKHYKLLNKITLIGISILLGSLLIPNLIYLLYEIINDVKKMNDKLLSFPERIKQRYLKVKSLNNSSICSFSFNIFFFKFPLLSPIRDCDFNSPKYIKHFITVLAISYGMALSLVLLLFYYPFEEKKDIIDKRDIKNPDFEIIDDDITVKYFIRCLIFTVFGAFITRIFIYIFGILLNYNKDELKYWKNLKTILSNYVNNQIKGDVLLGNTWKKIKMRMKAYSNICGSYILNKRLKKTGKKNENLEQYLLSSKMRDTESRLLPQNFDEEMTELSDKNKSGSYKPPSSEQSKNQSFNVGNINDSKNISLFQSNLEIVSGDSFQLYSTKLKIDKSIIKNNKYERIKNKYIRQKTHKYSYEEEVDSSNVSRSSSQEFNIGFKGLEIIYENNFSFLKLEHFIINETLSKGSWNHWRSSEKNKSITPEGYWYLINISLILTILLLVLICILITMFKKYLNDFGTFIINIWVACSVIVYIIIYPILYLIKNLIGSILLFKCYHLRNRVGGKILYSLFVDKTMIYIFKVRNYITKYKKELDY